MERTSKAKDVQAILIEDEESVRRATTQTLELGGFQVHACADAEQALALLGTALTNYAGIIVTDVRLPRQSGVALLSQIIATDPDLPVIVVTGHGDVSMAVEAMRAGAYDFIEKPFSAERLVETARRAQEKRRLILENRRLRQAWIDQPETPPLVGQSAAIERLRILIASIGPTSADVLINGQTGTGKEVVARQLHAASGRTGPFVAINCGALPESVFESEIFGHEAGAFTGAQKRRIGKLEYAQGGTVFLDEIESMPLALQIKLLRVLQERQLERLGGNDLITLDCRVVAASKSDLLQLAAQGVFREDLYYRIGVVSIALPRLRDRRDDIPLLIAHFMQAAALRYGREIPPWTQQQMSHWQQLDWPGNVRELRNFSDRWVLGVTDLVADQEANAAQPASMTLPQQLDACERALIERALLTTGANVANAADQLGIPRKTLYDKMKKYDLSAGRSSAS